MERKVKLHNYLAYGVGDFLGGGSFAIIGLFFIFFMTEVVGMIPFYAGTIYFISKLWDAVSDPLMGYISDRTRSRFGRRRVFFLIGIVPVGAFFALIWTPITFDNQVFLFLWYLFVFIAFSTFYTILMVPYTALNAEMSLDYKVRARMSGVKQFCSGLSGAICTVASEPLVGMFPDQQTGFLALGIIFGIFFSLPWLFVFLGTWEVPRKYGEVQKQKIKEIFVNFLSVFKNRSFRIHMGMYVPGFAAMDIVMAVFIIFLTYYIGSRELFPYLMAALALAQGASMPVYVFIGNRLGKGKAYLIGASIFLVGILYATTLTPGESLPMLIIAAVLLGIGMCGVTVMPWVILPSVVDVDELITSEKRAGTYSGMMTLLRKITNALVVFLVGSLLTLVGYAPDVAPTADTAEGVRYITLAGPFVAVFIGWLVSWRFRITPHTHKALREEIDRLEAGGSRDEVCDETKQICEELTGIEYADLYRSLAIKHSFDKNNKQSPEK